MIKWPQDTNEKVDESYGWSASPIRATYKPFQNFRTGHKSTSDYVRGLKVREIVRVVKNLCGQVHNTFLIFHSRSKTIACDGFQ